MINQKFAELDKVVANGNLKSFGVRHAPTIEEKLARFGVAVAGGKI